MRILIATRSPSTAMLIRFLTSSFQTEKTGVILPVVNKLHSAKNCFIFRVCIFVFFLQISDSRETSK